ncbi:MAG: Hpt domain-containing protein [Spirochaetales bacterium]|nr:Hpt domain-containing protein [Spirochaetales bacterium]
MDAAKNRELKLFFRDDAHRIQDFLRSFAQAWAKADPSANETARCFRDVHSLKSEAAFLGYTDIADRAEKIEKILAAARNAGKKPRDEELPGLLEDLCRCLLQTLAILNAELGEPDDCRPEPEAVEFSSDDFEMAMLQEAQYRGERFYRIDVEIDSCEPMPFPRLYLLVNNLELCASLIRITPPLDILKQDKDFLVSLYATTSRGSDSLEEALDVDGVISLEITEIPFGHIGPASGEEEEEAPGGEQPAESLPDYTREERKSVFLYQDELALYAFIAACLSAWPAKDSRGRLLAKALSIILRRQSGLSLALIMEKAGEMANEVASRLGKLLEVEVRVSGDVMVLPIVRDAVNGILTHLVRNAVDHGIETPDKRNDAGKLEWGRVILEAEIKKGTYTIRVADDGEGIRASEILEAAGNPDVKSGDTAGILKILTRPGFSTRKQVSSVSGRGVGLDVVRDLVIGRLGGKLTLDTKPGKGATFTVSFSDKTVKYPAFPARVGGRLLLMPRVMVERIFPLNAEKLAGSNRSFFYSLDGVSCRVRLFSGQKEPRSGAGILVRAGAAPFIIAASAVEEERMFRLAELVPSVSVLLARDF